MAVPPAPDSPAAALAALVEMLRRRGIRNFALTGGLALGAWTAPRFTRDLDLCAVVPLEAVDPILALHDGVRFGSEEIPAVIRFRMLDWDVDVFSSKSAYDLACLERAVPTEVCGCPLRVVSPEDLIIHKLHKLKDDRRRLLQDAADLRSLALARGDRLDQTYLRQWLPPADAELALGLASLDEAELVRRLLNRD